LKLGRVITIGTLCAAFASSQADTGTITFEGNVAGDQVSINFNGGVLDGYGGSIWVNEQDTSNPPASLGDIVTFCADLQDDFPPPTSWTVNIFDLPPSLNANPSNKWFDNNSLALAGSMVQYAATTYGGLASLTADEATAVQLDVWEALYDSGSQSAQFLLGRFI